MAKVIKTRNVLIEEKEGSFLSVFKRKPKKYTGIASLRQLLSNEKARLLHTIKTKQPDSIYGLAKLLGRDFKAVRQDIRLLERFGFIELISSHKHGRERIRPVLDADQVVITINL
jgi:predicted transcriptional regulator